MADFEKILAEEVKNYNRLSFPVKANLLERAIIRRARITKVHPNPDDEFCKPNVGPNYSKISDYIYRIGNDGTFLKTDPARESIIVEKIHPEGYKILNGHHRWAAYYKLGRKYVPIKLVNLTSQEDLERLLKASNHNKRVLIDFDQVIFRESGEMENELMFPLNRIYSERIRKGIPALFHFFISAGYDIWLFTDRLHSLEYMKNLFKLYHAEITGIITGFKRIPEFNPAVAKSIDDMFNNKYTLTLHIYNDKLYWVDRAAKVSKVFDLEDSNWSTTIKNIIGEMEENAKDD
ncbi:ParB/RepB/Spo0J family partition protein [Pseudobutyrivibrio xylanivorans]|uniref:Transcriptional regulator n=1 Tax=Pseudobutyrivibrio xylanivorans TaxID=185007 RepID=A0A5P6VV02_PSEXY|nr:ParB N-terminal domain-containing protein [Pseudobutyrivibrio xylanivorans]QFJ55114.1 transcriptional regulator [Pseudobutyrivibrio xylanivorans]